MIDRVHLFVDTNVFLHCKPLAEIPWSDALDATAIDLVVCRTVMRELDGKKYHNNNKIRRRAERAIRQFRALLIDDSGSSILRNSAPRVRLVMDTQTRPSARFDAALDYRIADDEIVGYAHGYKVENPETDVRLLTADVGMMATAKRLNLAFVPVKAEWQQVAATSELEKKYQKLKERVRQLEREEPEFTISCIDEDGETVDSLRVTETIWQPINEHDLNALRATLTKGVPAPFAISLYSSLLPLDRVKQDYDEWVARCLEQFGALHESLDGILGIPPFCLRVENRGTRPASSARLILTTTRSLRLRIPGDQDEGGMEVLPLPPKPERYLDPALRLRDVVTDLRLGEGRNWSTSLGPEAFVRSKDEFYYRTGRPKGPVRRVELEREHWQHGLPPVNVRGHVVGVGDELEVEGAMHIAIHAGNLRRAKERTIPVRLARRSLSAKVAADAMIEELLERRSGSD